MKKLMFAAVLSLAFATGFTCSKNAPEATPASTEVAPEATPVPEAAPAGTEMPAEVTTTTVP